MAAVSVLLYLSGLKLDSSSAEVLKLVDVSLLELDLKV